MKRGIRIILVVFSMLLWLLISGAANVSAQNPVPGQAHSFLLGTILPSVAREIFQPR